ncbi:P-loop containing nucleoside triphosphate hydrolase [Vigna unguiculata]|uniref:P-loop containing nucleoside triphosphate hydrolase n=1 Tax=Vigna unguiculata TaxID=3917 RepID=A0A4D6N0L2_VIGUN|nr:P-loop containing nucleoside triphosphate hydrolase [Vigna unguiculata]
MRAGVCSIQLQALTPEAATLVKQAVTLATRRGHAQVTPLHIATVMLATSTGLLRKACLQCHSHPLQYKALELCFNVSLNRLPASTPSPLLSASYSTTPSLSNALVAAFKRAQAHQRRGSIENQQQPILALKIEVEQLIVSILDDPSISRVMREAGFSSALVKTRVEQAVSMDVCSQEQASEQNTTKLQVLGGSNTSPPRSFSQFGGSFIKSMDHVSDEVAGVDDVTSALNALVSKRRNTVIVGESLASAEGVARGVMQRLERGNFVQFVSLPLFSFRNISKEEVERKLLELRSLVKSHVGRGFILYLGDLKWLFEFWSSYCEQRTNCYSSVEHMVMELKKLICGNGENGRLWLMGIATFRTYMKGKACHPSLETIWDLHPFTVPVGSLSLGLNFDSDFQVQERSKATFKDESFEERAKVRKHLTCCRDCSLNFEKEAKSIANSITISKRDCTTSLPTWLKNCKEERSHVMDDQENAKLKEICRKWNSFCSSAHGYPSNIEKQFLFISSSPSPSSPTSASSHERKSSFNLTHLNWPVISEPKEVSKECQLYTETTVSDECYEGNLIMFMPERNIPKPDLLSNPNSSPNSASSSEAAEGLDSTQMFKEHNDENLKILSDALQKMVPQNKETAKEIASTVLLCRSGMRKGENHLVKREDRQETWFFFQGMDSGAKETVSKELAKVVFGSYTNFVPIGVSSFSGGDSTNEESKNKRPRDEFGGSYLQRFGEAVNENPHRVFFMEDLEQVDHFSKKGVKKAIENGTITLPCGESVPLKDAIVIFSSENFSSAPARTTSPSSDENMEKENLNNSEEKTPCLSLDLNMAIEVDAQKNVHLDEATVEIAELVDKQIKFHV